MAIRSARPTARSAPLMFEQDRQCRMPHTPSILQVRCGSFDGGADHVGAGPTVVNGDELRAYQDWLKSGLIAARWRTTSPAYRRARTRSCTAGCVDRCVPRLSCAYTLINHPQRGEPANDKVIDHDAMNAGHDAYAAGNRPPITQGDVARVQAKMSASDATRTARR